MENYCYKNTSVIDYSNDAEYRNCLREVFQMQCNIDKDLDPITQDENNYDVDAAAKARDSVWEKTKDHALFKNLYLIAASKMMSNDPSIGLAVLFSYDNLKYFHPCLVCYFTNKDSFHEGTSYYQTMFTIIK